MDRNQILKYLAAVRELEAGVYMHEKAISRLNRNYSDASARYKNNRYSPLRRHGEITGDIPPLSAGECAKQGFLVGLGMMIPVEIAAVIVGIIFALLTHGLLASTESVGASVKGTLILGAIICVIIGIATGYHNYYENQFGSSTWQKIERDNEIIIRNNKEQMEADMKAIKYLPEEVDILQGNLQELRSLLSNYYAIPVLHRDYQNFVAVCSIHQYFESGRCSTLGDAYNLFEDEKFKRLVLYKLDDIINRLSQIQQTQRELYDAISRCESQIHSLTYAVSNMSDNLDSVSKSNAVIAYNTTCIRQLEEYQMQLSWFR
ncbi:MAG: hypothetical protein IJ055_00125 [Oscillospiraceae bacterium]|nr:hypothetical protein [Oscillospiraceae bacterium]